MSTPGHGGRDCASPGYWDKKVLEPGHGDSWIVKASTLCGAHLTVWHCPAKGCGIKLTPDAPKLVPCPSCGGEVEMESASGGYGVCLDDACMVCGPSNDPTGEKWNKAFGAKKPFNLKRFSNLLADAFMDERGWPGTQKIERIYRRMEAEEETAK